MLLKFIVVSFSIPFLQAEAQDLIQCNVFYLSVKDLYACGFFSLSMNRVSVKYLHHHAKKLNIFLFFC